MRSKPLQSLILLYLQLSRRSDARRVFVVVEFARSPASFFRALHSHPELKRCREALSAANLPLEIGDKAQVLLDPEHYHIVIQNIKANGVTFNDGTHVREDALRARHLVCSVDMGIADAEAVAEIKYKDKVKVKRQVTIDL